MESEEPDKGGETERRWKQEPDRAPLAEPEVRQKTAHIMHNKNLLRLPRQGGD